MSHIFSFSPKNNNNKITSLVYQFYSNKGLVFQSPIYTNEDTLKLEAFKKLIKLNDNSLRMEIVKFV